MFWFRIITASLLPILLAHLFYYLQRKTCFGKRADMFQQIIIGLAFGIVSCLATQFGIPFDGYVLNVRSASPLTAGLVFGGPAGLIVGTIGALYRWFSVCWGVPEYTRVACSVATLLSGVISALCRNYMFDKKKPSWFYGMFIAIATEVFHMLLVFLTHMDNITRAFEVVRHTAVTMITANSLSVLLVLVSMEHLSKRTPQEKKKSRPMSQIFALYLFACVLVAFIVTCNFSYYLQNNVSNLQVNNLLSMNVGDVESDIADALDRDLLNRTNTISQQIKTSRYYANRQFSSEAFRDMLYELTETYSVSEINFVGPDGIILASTVPAFIGFDMSSDPEGQAAEFLCLLQGEKSYVQDYQPMDYDNTVWRKYAGVALDNGYFVEVGYDRDHFQHTMLELLKNVATNRHIGQTGFIFILDPASEDLVVSAPADTVTVENATDFVSGLSDTENKTVLQYETPDGQSFYYMKDTVEGYIVVGCISENETFFSRDISVYISAFMQLVVFFVLFLLVFFLLKNIIVNNIHKINQSLAKITGGDLETRVEVQANEEFANLSHDINTTVSRLKEYISDAEKRIDQELAFAKSIQHSAIPTVFPPFPNHREFDIFASMDTAKEVGGDFYDFYLLGRNHLVFTVADVSGKGIPAALFMMTAKTMIKSYAESGLSVAEVFTLSNEKLCESNEAGMFVTAWMGILNLKTGVVKYANAGHNPPAVRHKDGSFSFLQSRRGFVLAGMEGITYLENEVALAPGDEIFLYTDGVTEATDSKDQLLGDARLLSTLNQNANLSAEGLCRAVKKDIDCFVGEVPQFDDITMLSLKFKCYADANSGNA